MLRSGVLWRNLPSGFGRWNSVFKRYARWCRFGVWEKILTDLTQQSDIQHVCIDSAMIRAHACAAGAASSTASNEALGRFRGGFGCNIHALTDALGLPIRFILTGGQEIVTYFHFIAHANRCTFRIHRETSKDKTLHLIAYNYVTHKHPHSAGMARQASALQHALHAHERFVAEHGRALFP